MYIICFLTAIWYNQDIFIHIRAVHIMVISYVFEAINMAMPYKQFSKKPYFHDICKKTQDHDTILSATH